MATDPSEFDDFLKRFDRLNREEKEALLEKLERRQTTVANNNASGRTVLDAMKERGMLGSIKGAPADWSSNPKYLEGLGQNNG